MATKDDRPHGGLRIKVTEQDIAKAEQSSSMRCVVARAIARTIPDATRIDVDVQSIRWTQDGERYVYLTPYSVQGYVVAFDAGDEILPFTFGLDARRRVPVRRSTITPAGKAIKRARQNAKNATNKRERVEKAAAAGEVTPAAVEKAKGDEQAKAKEHADARAAYAGQVLMTREKGEGRPQGPPRVQKSSERAYGMRLLRINRDH